MKQTANQRTKKSDMFLTGLPLHHAAIRSGRGLESPPTVAGDSASANNRDFSQVPINSTVSSRGRSNLTQLCPFSPQRCPFGGACHTCPPRVLTPHAVGIQRKATNNNELTEVPPSADEVSCFEHDFSSVRPHAHPPGGLPGLSAQTGRPLPEGVQGILERQFQAPLGSVQIHDNAAAAHAARRHGAQAMTQGEHIYFGRGQFRPHSHAGHQLLVHEITHVLQQRRVGSSSGPQALEDEAQLMARQSSGTRKLPPVRYAAPNPTEPLLLASAARTAVEDELDDVFYNIENAWPQIRAASQTERNDLATDPVIQRNLRRRSSPMELLKTYLLLAHQNESQFPAHYQAFIEATDIAGTHEARIYAILRGVTQTERTDMQNMPGLVEVIEDEMSGDELQQALRLLYEGETRVASGTSNVHSSIHLEMGERYRLNVQATGSFEQAKYNIEEALGERVEQSSALLADTSLWARFADNFGAEQVWYLRMIARYRSPNFFPEIPPNNDFISTIWDSVEGAGTDEDQLIGELTNVAAATTATGGGGRTLRSPPRLELTDDPWFVPMLESELSGRDLQQALGAVSATGSSSVNIRDALEDAIDDHDMARIRTLLTSATLSAANRNRLRNDPVILDEMGEELNGAQLCETSLLLRYGSAPFPANAQTMLNHFQQDPINVSAVETFLIGLSNNDQSALRAEPGIYFMITNSGLDRDDSSRLLAAIRSQDTRWNWQTAGSEGRYRTKTENIHATLPVRFTSSEVRIAIRLNIDTSRLTDDYELSSGTVESWNRAIDEIWNNRYRLRSGSQSFAFVFAPYMTIGVASPDAIIYVMNRSGRSGAQRRPDGLRDLYLYLDGLEPETVAHEFGHMFGNPDEYDLISSEYQRISGQTPQSPPVPGGETVETLMGSQYISTSIEDRHVLPATEIVNRARDTTVFPLAFAAYRI